MAVLPSALTATEMPCWAAPVLPVPTSLLPCCTVGNIVVLIVKFPVPLTVPDALVTDIRPVAEPGITIPTSFVAVLDTTMAAVPPMVKAVGLPRLVPVMVTSVPGLPLAGEKELIVGACAQT